MTGLYFNELEALFSFEVFAVVAAIFLRTTPDNLRQREAWCRHKWAGLLLTLPSVLRCVPLAAPVSPEFLAPWLLPLAIVLPILCFFHIDAYAARGLALWLIVAAYGQIHTAFDCRIPGAAAVTVVCWLGGIAGIWLSAKPYLLRDALRLAAVRRTARLVGGGFAGVLALTSLYVLIMTILAGGPGE